MKIRYSIIDPSGNITALVTSPVEKADFGAVAAHIIKKHPQTEQVGFVGFKADRIFLNMAGDEFCGNAVMSAAALFCQLSCGAEQPRVPVTVTPLGLTVPAAAAFADGGYNCKCTLPPPKSVSDISFTANGRDYTFPAVRLEGITHIVADNTLSPQAGESVIKPLAKKLKVPALGLMLYDKSAAYMKPLVYVPGADTLFFENSCASGSCAVAYLKGRPGEKISITQPGGVITAENGVNGVTLYNHATIIDEYSEDI